MRTLLLQALIKGRAVIDPPGKSPEELSEIANELSARARRKLGR